MILNNYSHQNRDMATTDAPDDYPWDFSDMEIYEQGWGSIIEGNIRHQGISFS